MKTNILLFDIETAPHLGYTWDKYQQNVLAFVRERYLLSFAYKWLGDGGIKAMSLRTHPGRTLPDDKRLVKELWKVLNDANVVVAHNGRDFDVKVAQAFFVRHGMKPPRPFVVVDTKIVAKRHFRFTANSLADIARYLHIGSKLKTSGINLWIECMKGDVDAWHRMELYNKRDVELLEKVYLRLRPYMDRHPNMNVLLNRAVVCPNCGGKILQSQGWHITRVSRARRYHCQSCGGWCHGKLERMGVELR